MILLSIHDGHNASAAIYKDGVLLSCVSEERINRKKFFWGWPKEAIDFVLNDSKLRFEDIEIITISHLSGMKYFLRKWSLLSSYKIWKPKAFIGHFYNIFQSFKREFEIRRFRNKNCPQARVFFCDHHLAHAASAYYCSGKDDTLVITCDALGDSLSHTAYSVKKGVWRKILQGDSPESLGSFYAAVTEGLGFKPNQHEGKVVGLAAYAPSNILLGRMRRSFVSVTKKGLHFSRSPYVKMIASIKNLLKEGFTKEQISSAAQTLLEESMVFHVRAILEIEKHDSLCLAGGVFANVKLNQRLIEQTKIKDIFIQPAMGDEGLVLGSALWYLNNFGKKTPRVPLEHVYLGTHYKDEEIIESIKKTNRTFDIISNAPEKLADLIANGAIVGVFNGRMEFGPRALGARSIIADPRNKNINEILNKRLRRSEFMPFAPSVLSDKADEIFENVTPARHTAEFMTITFNANIKWKEKIPAIVHIDGTARPQLVRQDRNLHYYSIIDAFYRKTGVPLVMNTSFNIHEEPIVSSPEDALRSLDSGAVDYILFNNNILVR